MSHDWPPGTYLINYDREYKQIGVVESDGRIVGRNVRNPQHLWFWPGMPSYVHRADPSSPYHVRYQAAWTCLDLGLSDAADAIIQETVDMRRFK